MVATVAAEGVVIVGSFPGAWGNRVLVDQLGRHYSNEQPLEEAPAPTQPVKTVSALKAFRKQRKRERQARRQGRDIPQRHYGFVQD